MFSYAFSIRIFLYSGDNPIITRLFTGTVQAASYTDAGVAAWTLINREIDRLRGETGRSLATAEFRVDLLDPSN
jgi:hypothetical protein